MLVERPLLRSLLGCVLVTIVAGPTRAGDVVGRVVLPETCSPAVSPAVVRLIPADGSAGVAVDPSEHATLALIRQQALRFEPRVLALAPGQSVQFTNHDPETHNVHILGTPFSQSMPPGQPLDFRPETPGVYRVVCDVHAHMRAYLIASETPWFATVDRQGAFRIVDVPPGAYTLYVWHEIGEPLRRPIEVAATGLDLGTIVVAGPASTSIASKAREPIRPWADVIDRVSLVFAASLDASAQPGGRKVARRLAEDAYYAEFEANGMEIAVGRYLGESDMGGLERRFRDLIRTVGQLPDGRPAPAAVGQDIGLLLMELNKAAEALNRLGVTDRSKIGTVTLASGRPAAGPVGGIRDLSNLRRAFDRVVEVADRGDRDDAASALSDAYFDAFEPIERNLLAFEPATVPALEARFGRLRGRLGAGLKGTDLKSELDALLGDTGDALDRAEDPAAGAMGAAFLASLVTIVREGVEVILILTMLLTLVARAGRPDARRAILAGVAAAAVASLATAIALNRLVSASKAQVGELVEGVVMLAASIVLFYVSYWLISQTEAKRWTDFLKKTVQEGAAGGRLWVLGLTAFLAVYREGAETALMYQAMLGVHESGAGRTGLALGLGVGLAILVVVYWAIRRAGAKLPLRTFFSISGALLFALAVVFAGKGVFELQQAGVLKVTPLPSIDRSLPLLGFYPNLQVAAIQGLLLAGAFLSWVLLLSNRAAAGPTGAAPGAPGHGPVHAGSAAARSGP